jgi:hypothetical protein
MTELRYKSAKRVLKTILFTVLAATVIVVILAAADWSWRLAQLTQAAQAQCTPPAVQNIPSLIYGTGIKVAPNTQSI